MNKASKIFIWLLIAAAALAAAAAGIWKYNIALNKTVRLTEYTFDTDKIPYAFDGYKLIVISDIHNADFSDQIVSMINSQQPDAVLFTGDLVQLPDDDLTNTIKILDETADLIPTYVISGNHESQNFSYYDISCELEDHGAVFIDNKSVYLWKNNEKIRLIGVMDPPVDELDENSINKMRKTVISNTEGNEEYFTIAACHRSNAYPHLKDLPADLILSGHLHGGIIRLPFIGGVIGKSEAGLFPEYDYGMYKEGHASMIVSGGCDNNPKKRRFFNPPEILLITLKKMP